MKIIAHIPLYLPAHNSGGETTAHALFKALIERGHEVQVIVERSRFDEYDGIKIHELNYLHGSRRDILELYKWSDVVYTHLGCVGMVENITRHDVPREVVYYYHNSHGSSAVERNHSNKYHVVYNTEWVKEHLKSTHNHKNDCVVNPVIEFEKLNKTKKGEYITIINANENKGGRKFVEIANKMPKNKFLIVKGSYGKQFIDDLPDNVEVVENTPDLTDVWNKTAIILMPSLYESFGRVAIEANYMGIPVISTPTKGLVEATMHKGIYELRENTQGWCSKIKNILSNYDKYSKKATKIGKEAMTQNKKHKQLFCNFVENINYESKSIKEHSNQRPQRIN